MARTSKSRGAAAFTMRSGNKPSVVKMAGVSPIRIDPTDTKDTKDTKDTDVPYVREAGTKMPMIEEMGRGLSEAASRAKLNLIPSEGGGSYSTPGLDNLYNHIQGMETGKERDSAIARYTKKYNEMQASLKASME